jgi:phage pi2 protein 07
MFNPSRDQARQFFFDTWRKYKLREVLSPMEDIALEVILLHPEYHAMLDDIERYQDKDYLPEMGATNPFLHMSMHIAIKEQLSIDQPAGIRKRYESLLKKTSDEHAVMHQIMECLAEMIWQAQRAQTGFDASVYFECLDRQESGFST